MLVYMTVYCIGVHVCMCIVTLAYRTFFFSFLSIFVTLFCEYVNMHVLYMYVCLHVCILYVHYMIDQVKKK